MQAPQRDRSHFFVPFFFFLLLSIALRIGSKPPPSHMKVLSFVRDVWTFEMTPKIFWFLLFLTYLIISRTLNQLQ